ncbi:MAG: serine/threonine protein kinase [Flavobacteriaceae bacterium]|nr:MAG: serine/threonine protein kinase [Flavobacteriaceae bacterium]
MSLFNFIKSKAFLKQLIIAIIGVVLLLFLLTKWLDVTTNHDQKIQVPDLSKLTISEVTTVLDELNLKAEIIDSTNFNPEYPPLSVIEQHPEAGDFVKEKRRIYLKINRPTYQNIAIPNVFAKPRRNAEATLRAVGFRVGNNPKYVKDIAKDVVRGLYFKGKPIMEGDLLPRNSLLELKLGDGGDRNVYKKR